MSEYYVHEACNSGKLVFLKEVLEAGADPNEKDGPTGSLPLHWAARGRHFECANHMIQNKLNDVNFQNSAGNSPLHYATISGTKKITQLLVEAGAEMNIKNNAGQTPLHGATGEGWTHVIEYLATAQSNIQDQNKSSRRRQDKKVLDLNAQDNNGMTCLHYASKHFSSETFELLLKLGADPTIKNNYGELPVNPRKKYHDAVNVYGPILALLTALLCAYFYHKYKALRIDEF